MNEIMNDAAEECGWRSLLSYRSNAQATMNLQLTVGRRSNANGEATAGIAESLKLWDQHELADLDG